MKKCTFTLLFLLLLCACQKSKEKATQTTLPYAAERSAFFSNLKTPAEVAGKLNATGMAFNAGLMSDPKNFIAYANNPIKGAANLGIYLSDLNYAIAYQEGPHTKELFTAAYELSKVMGIEKRMLDFLMKRYADNLAQNDSVKSVVSALYVQSTSGVQGTERERLVGIAMAAYQIENLHLALGLIESYPKEKLAEDESVQKLAPVYQIVAGQKNNLQITYGFLKSITDVTDPDKNPNYPFYSNAFSELIAVYDRLHLDEKLATPHAELTNDAVIKELSDKVNAIRGKIISGE